jgi:hypothetical protein
VIAAAATCGELVSTNNQGDLRERAPSGNCVVARVLTVSTPEIYRSDLQAFMPEFLAYGFASKRILQPL